MLKLAIKYAFEILKADKITLECLKIINPLTIAIKLSDLMMF